MQDLPAIDTLVAALVALDAAITDHRAGADARLTEAASTAVVALHNWSRSHVPGEPIYLDLDDFVGAVLAGV